MKRRKTKHRRKKIHLMNDGEARQALVLLNMRGKTGTTYGENLWHHRRMLILAGRG